MPQYDYGQGAKTSLTKDQFDIFSRLQNTDSLLNGGYPGGPEQYAKDVQFMQSNPGLLAEHQRYTDAIPVANANDFSSLVGSVVTPDLVKAGLTAMFTAGMGNAAGLWDLGGAAAGGEAAGTAMFAPEAAGGYQSFTAPEALTGVNAAPSIGSSGLKELATSGGLLKDVGKFIADNKTAGLALGGLLGAAAGKDTTTSAQKDPWGPAQGYLKDNLAQNAAMQQYYQQNPFSAEQKAAYQGLLNTNANGLANAGNYAQIANNFMQSNRGQMPTMPGLLTGQTAAPVNWAAYSNIGKKA